MSGIAWDVEAWLRDDGEPGSAHAWRTWCARLEGGPVVVVAARDPALAARVAAEIGASPVGIADEPGPGLQERLAGAHGILWATSAAAALGADERALLDRLAALGAPGHRGIRVADRALLARLSDDPDAEAEEIARRLARVAPWPVVDDVAAWRAAIDPGARVRELAAAVVADQVERAEAEAERYAAGIRAIDETRAAEDARLAEAAAAAARVGRHLRAGLARQVSAIEADLGAFLVELEHALPAEIAATPPELAGRALPHWLQHVVGQWLDTRLATATVALRDDLAGIVSDDDLARSALVLPAVAPAPVRGEAEWRGRLGATLAIGGGAALVLFGLWAPGLAAVAGGVAWSAFGRGDREAATRATLLATGVDAVRALATDLPAALHAQLAAVEPEIAVAGADRADTVARRAELVARREAAQARAARWRERRP